MMGTLIVLHAIICVLLIIIILIQAGRGSGLVEGFSGVESMFGTKTNAFLTRITTVFSTLFLISCVTLAVLSARQSRSLLRNAVANQQPEHLPFNQTVSEKQQEPLKTSRANITESIPSQKSPNQAAPKQEPVAQGAVRQEAPKNR